MTNEAAPQTTPSQIWVYQKTSEKPAWVQAVVAEGPQPNGTFMINSEFGQARVHPGNVVFEFHGHIYACAHSEITRTVAELKDRFIAPPPVVRNDKALVADVAPRDDVTDDITRRIRGQAIVPQTAAKSPPTTRPEKAESITPAPQKIVTSALQAAAASTAPKKHWPATKGMPPSIENRHPGELKIDDSYQRSTDTGASQTLIKKIATGWDWRMCMPLVVSKRDDGSLWVIDGQHRLAGALLRGDIPFLPCCVGVYGGVAEEAAMFVAMNRARRPMNRLDDFHAAIASGDGEAMEVAKLITDAGFTVSRKTGSQSWVPGEVAFTSAVANQMRKHGPKPCATALASLNEAFPGEVLNAGASMFTALVKLEINPPSGFDPDRMFRALLTRNQKEWASFLNEVKGGGEERALQLRKVLLMAYEEVPEV